ncbi:MAG: acyltransferase [Nitrospiraceae bacterium]|nr:MAG: acyltransferase [Nitrospiraceae bacterium]
MKVGFYQFSPAFGEKEKNINKVVTAIKDTDAHLLVLPEFFATGYQFISEDEVDDLSEQVPKGPTTEALIELSHEKNIYIVAGLPERAGDKFYNSAVFTGPEGFIGFYRKTHLFSEETLYFTPGDTGFRVWDTKIGRIGIKICFDWFFPESMRSLALLGAEVVAHPSNLVLPFCPDSMPVRCLENRVFAVTANRIGTEHRRPDQSLTFIGKSEVVSPRGEILVRASDDEESLMSVSIDPTTARDKVLNQYNDLLKARRPDLYGPLY